MTKTFFYIVALLLIEGLFLSGCQTEKVTRSIHGKTMGTTYTIKVVGVTEAELTDIKRLVEHTLAEVNQLFSTYIAESEISRLNRAPVNEWIEVSPSFYEMWKSAQEIWQLTSGAFDPTVGPLVNLWGFGPNGPKQRPSDKELAAVLAGVGMEKVKTKESVGHIYLKRPHPKTYIDFSAIAKGGGVDAVGRRLEELGIKHYMVEIGGEILVKGTKGNRSWTLGIEQPGPERAVIEAIELKDMAMATSGDYRNFLAVDGEVFSHTIDPKSGRPAKHNLTSVTVLDPRCARADALATALLALGPERAAQLAENANIPAMFIIRSHGQGAKRFIIKKSAQFRKLLGESH